MNTPVQSYSVNRGRVEGNVVRVAAPAQVAPQQLARRKRARISRAQQKAIQRQKVRLVLLGAAAAVLLVGLSVVMLASLEKNGTLTQEISARESEVEKLTVYNDAREYEIESSVDLNAVIAMATEELGMVRSSAAQVVTYSVKNSEYLQQVAVVPVD